MSRCVVALVRPDAAIAGAAERLDFGEGTALTDENGHFSFAGVAPGDYEITAKQLFGTTGRTGRLSSITLGAGQEQDDLEVVLENGGTLRVHVRDAGGGVRANALVTILGDSGAPLDLFHRTLTDVDGTVTFGGLPDGSYRVAVDAPGAAPAVAGPVAMAKGATRELEVSLARGKPVRVVVTGGVPELLRGQLVLYSVWRGDGSLVRTGRVVLPDSPEANASVTIGRLEPGEYRARLEAPRLGIVDVTRTVPEGGDAVWNLELPR